MASSESSFPIRDPVEADPPAEVVTLEDAGELIDALHTETARSIITALSDEPAPASDLAATTETSLQNVQYHLDRLAQYDLIEVVDTWYSKKGREMSVYGIKNDPVVVVIGDDGGESEIKEAVSTCH